jgi:aldose 1-epimerase
MGRQRDIDVVLGYVSAEDYDLDPFYLGSTVGPVANRIADGKVTLVSGTFSISINEPSRSNALHGGELGLHQQIFQPSPTSASDSLTLSRQLPHLSDGFPGNRLVTVHYELVDATSLQCDFAATTDRETVINVANHAYFNLGGPLADHEFRAHCEHFTPFDEQLIPIGTITSLSGSELDFRNGTAWAIACSIIISFCVRITNSKKPRAFACAIPNCSSMSSQRSPRFRCTPATA